MGFQGGHGCHFAGGVGGGLGKGVAARSLAVASPRCHSETTSAMAPASPTHNSRSVCIGLRSPVAVRRMGVIGTDVSGSTFHTPLSFFQSTLGGALGCVVSIATGASRASCRCLSNRSRQVAIVSISATTSPWIQGSLGWSPSPVHDQSLQSWSDHGCWLHSWPLAVAAAWAATSTTLDDALAIACVI